MKKVNNTSNNPRIDWLFGQNPNAILNQESEGQKELVDSDQLPLRCNDRNIASIEQYALMGIKVIGPSEGDNLFLDVKLPEGWKKVSTDHSMWNELIDDKGRVRATFFYKAAFYDRDAFISFRYRYLIDSDFPDMDTRTYFVKDTFTNEVIFHAGTASRYNDTGNYFDLQDQLRDKCKEWLLNNFPNWQDVNAYWD